MESIKNILRNYGILGVQMLKAKIEPLSATGETVDSIKSEVSSDNDTDTLTIFAREFLATLETGRGPRKSATNSGFQDNLLEYVKVKHPELPAKKQLQLAKFWRWRINKEGDATFKKGGRVVYSDDLDKFIIALKEALKKDFVLSFRNNLKSALRGNNDK